MLEPTQGNQTGFSISVSPRPAEVVAWLKNSHSFESLQAYLSTDVTFEAKGTEPATLHSTYILPTFPQFAGQRVLLGRMFTQADIDTKQPVALLGEGVWRSRFGSNRAVIGQSVTINDKLVTIIGVLPSSLILPRLGRSASDVWLPLEMTQDRYGVAVIGKLKEGLSYADAATELDNIAKEVQTGASGGRFRVKVFGMRELVPFRRSLILLTAAVALLIAPSAYHCIVTRAGAEGQLERGITWLINISLGLLAVAIGLDLYVVGDQVIGGVAGPLLGIAFCLCAFAFWYGLELMHLRHRRKRIQQPSDGDAHSGNSIEDRINFVLTETRVVLPGAQALLGFQLVVLLSRAFENLPPQSAYVHVAALASVAVSTVLLIAPAAHHRIVFGGEAAEEFPAIAGAYLLGATIFLALGMAGDCYMIVAKVASEAWGIAMAAAFVCLCFGLWYALPLAARRRH